MHTSIGARLERPFRAPIEPSVRAPLHRQLCPLERDYVVERLVEGPLRAPVEQLAQRGGVGLAPAKLLEAVVVGIVVSDESDPRARVRTRDDPPGEFDDRDRLRAPDVEGASCGSLVLR